MDERREALYSGIEDLRQRAEVFAIKVHPLYVALEWTWKDSKVPPGPKEIEATLQELLDDLCDAVDNGRLDEPKGYRCSTGGLEAGYCGQGEFLMAFGLEEWVGRSDWVLTFEERQNDK